MKCTMKCLFTVLSLVFGMSACTVSVKPIPGAVVVSEAPPRTVVEVQTVAPGSNYIWIDGYWSWSGSRWYWSAGHWETQRLGYYWVAPHYTYSRGRHYYAPGGWTRDQSYNANNGYRTTNPKCPKGYVWYNNACRYRTGA